MLNVLKYLGKMSSFPELNTIIFTMLCFMMVTVFLPEKVCQAQEFPETTTELNTANPATGEYPLAVEREKPSTDEYPLHGYISTKYKFRTTGDESDQDIYQYLSIDAGDPLRNGVTAHIFVRGSADLDGQQDANGYYLYDSIDDTYDDKADLRLYYAYLDFHKVKYMKLIRVGRQSTYDTPVPLNFDGLKVETKEANSPFKPMLGVYGGIPSSHLYDPDPEDDLLYGAYARFIPWVKGRMQLHWTHFEEKSFYGVQGDDLLAIVVRQNLGKYLTAQSRYTMLDEESRDLLIRATYSDAELNLIVQTSYYALLETQEINTSAFDPYYAVGGQYFPYREFSATLYKGLGKRYALDGGFTGRKLNNESDEGQYNHEFVRYFATFSAFDVPMEGLKASITGDIWDSYTVDERTISLGAEIGYAFSDRFEASLGTEYAHYKYDYYFQSELEDVRTYYTEIKYKVLDDLRLALEYQIEDDELDEYHLLEATIKYSF